MQTSYCTYVRSNHYTTTKDTNIFITTHVSTCNLNIISCNRSKPRVSFNLTTQDFAIGTISASLRLLKMRKSNSRSKLWPPLWFAFVLGMMYLLLWNNCMGIWRRKLSESGKRWGLSYGYSILVSFLGPHAYRYFVMLLSTGIAASASNLVFWRVVSLF